METAVQSIKKSETKEAKSSSGDEGGFEKKNFARNRTFMDYQLGSFRLASLEETTSELC